MIRVHPSVLMADFARAQWAIGCCLKTDSRGRLMVVPLRDTYRGRGYGTYNLVRCRRWHHLDPSDRPQPEGVA